ncbi:MAG: alanine--tRNA ligase [Gammaproteobacteria bacterium]|nr:alanine--tRNA ligase [Gammaproteobacteria bacterium]MBI5616494.1 alanine--tRNA ligase [Gammaproteobacteria bacterium]
MKSADIRENFLAYFAGKGHSRIDSSPLVPGNDPSLLFTNAGMVQFKDVFLGLEERDYKRAATSQRCVRAGGKHNDLDNVGYTARHHTFFEMLGNFSFGDYFKREAIEFAWELLTVRFGLPPEKLWVTVFESDDEAAAIWQKHIGVDPKRFTRCGEKDNFWMMGDTGPCGPCSEIFYDHGPSIAGGPPGSPDADGDRYVEIWNLVFMQFERDASGQLKTIPRPSVDTGMGLERVSAVLQGVHNNYDIDLFQRLIGAIRDIAPRGELETASLRVIADHIRACSFLVMDGVIPSNEGRGYVLRRIMRRALRHGNKLGFKDPFFHRLVKPLNAEMGVAFPQLGEKLERIEQVLKQEEERFAETLDQGLKIFEQAVSDLSGKVIPGEVAFKLNDTYGFPVDLTQDIARERGLGVDLEGYEKALDAQRERARAASQFTSVDTSQAVVAEDLAALGGQQVFAGYEHTRISAIVTGLFVGGAKRDELKAGEAGIVALDRTSFYAESGGQVGDKGRLVSGDGVFEVQDTRKQGGVHLHYGQIKLGVLRVGDVVQAEVDDPRRQATRLNHSATHLLHAALRQVLGTHVEQKGSLVDPERLRFDFAHPQAMTAGELAEVERLVNAEIRGNHEVETKLMNYQQALEAGAMALFGEKYGEEVRVLRMGGFSVELCGGTHAARTGDIGFFKIVAESGVAAGVRRIEGTTGATAVEAAQAAEQNLRRVAGLVKGTPADLESKVQQLVERSRQQDKEIQALKQKLATQSGRDLADSAVQVGEVKVLAEIIEGADAAALRDAMDKLKDRLPRAAIVLATVEDGKVRLVAGVTKDLTGKLHAGNLAGFVAGQVGGKGGGRPDMAQAGGTDAAALPAALASVPGWVAGQLG